MSLDVDHLTLRERERGLLIGGTGSGKSTLADVLGSDWDRRYARKGGRRLVVDTKPRYHAQWQVNGVEAKRRYKGWRGTFIPGSVVVDDPRDLALAWQLGHRVVIVQGEGARDAARVIATVREFYRQANGSRPQLVQIDECLDLYHGNGVARGGDDVVTQCARAGRERGVALLAGSQRTRQLPATLMSEMSKLWAFRLDYTADAKRFREFGCPEFTNPSKPHVFHYWTKDDYPTVFGPYKLALPNGSK